MVPDLGSSLSPLEDRNRSAKLKSKHKRQPKGHEGQLKFSFSLKKLITL